MAHTQTEFIQTITAEVRRRTDDRVADVFASCFENTLGTTLREQPDGTLFMLTGDIPAMWLRDSTAQLAPYLHFAATHPEIGDMIAGVSRRQIEYILLDPYANAFNAAPDGSGHSDDETQQSPWVWERKYEIDTLCYPIQLAHDLWSVTGRTDHLGERFASAARAAIAVWRTEQRHEELSPYRFQRHHGPATDTLVREGRGSLTAPTGMTWAGFRPSDDACELGYNVPGNMFAAVALAQLEELATQVLDAPALATEASALREEIVQGIDDHAVVTTGPVGSGERVYAYEVDGRGGVVLMDDANVPSLLSLPLIGWCTADDPLYLSTRAFVLSTANPTFWTGVLPSGNPSRGIGSPHTPPEHIWPIALCVEALTTSDPGEKQRILSLLVEADAGTGLMHESFHVDDPAQFTRPWFSWANAMFCELVLDVVGIRRLVRTPIAAGTRA